MAPRWLRPRQPLADMISDTIQMTTTRVAAEETRRFHGGGGGELRCLHGPIAYMSTSDWSEEQTSATIPKSMSRVCSRGE